MMKPMVEELESALSKLTIQMNEPGSTVDRQRVAQEVLMLFALLENFCLINFGRSLYPDILNNTYSVYYTVGKTSGEPELVKRLQSSLKNVMDVSTNLYHLIGQNMDLPSAVSSVTKDEIENLLNNISEKANQIITNTGTNNETKTGEHYPPAEPKRGAGKH